MCVYVCVCVCVCVCVYLEQEVHEAAVGLHLVLQLVEDDEGREGKPDALWMKERNGKNK